MPNEKVVVSLDDATLPAATLAQIRALSPRIELLEKRTPEGLARADVVYTNGGNWDRKDSPKLKWIQVDTAAVNGILSKPLGQSGIPIANVRGAYSVSVAEFSLGLILTITRRLHQCRDMQNSHEWIPDRAFSGLQGESLHGKTLGIVGYGSIGRHVARIAHAMGMTILACKRRPDLKSEDGFIQPNTGDPEGKLPREWFGFDRVRDMFAKTDVVLVTLPKTPATMGFIGQRELAALPKGSYFVNIGRGGVVDELALTNALKSGHLAAAALDVFVNEPLETESPLWTAPNFMMAPHIASYTKDQTARAGEVLIENLRRHLAGKPLINLINAGEGY